jgi:hypothetical protein
LSIAALYSAAARLLSNAKFKTWLYVARLPLSDRQKQEAKMGED